MRKTEIGDPYLGRVIYELRKRCKRTQEEVAFEMSIKADKLRRFERGEQLPSLRELRSFRSALGLSQTDWDIILDRYLATGKAGKSSADISLEPLRFASVETDFITIDGVPEYSVPLTNIEIQIDETPAEIPSHLFHFYDQYVKKINERKNLGDSQVPFDGDILAVRDIQVTRTPNIELPRWLIILKKNSYYNYMSLLKNLDAPAADEKGRRRTIRKQFLLIEDYNPRHPPPFINHFGVSSAVHLRKEDRLVFAKRGATELLPESFGAAVGEGLHPTKDIRSCQDPSSSVVNCALRGVKEELGLEISPDSVTFLSLGFDRHHCQYGIAALLSVDLFFKELLDSAIEATDGKFETAKIFSIPARPIMRALKELIDITRRTNLIWPPFPLATLWLVLFFLNNRPVVTGPLLSLLKSSTPYNLMVPHFPPLMGS